MRAPKVRAKFLGYFARTEHMTSPFCNSQSNRLQLSQSCAQALQCLTVAIKFQFDPVKQPLNVTIRIYYDNELQDAQHVDLFNLTYNAHEDNARANNTTYSFYKLCQPSVEIYCTTRFYIRRQSLIG